KLVFMHAVKDGPANRSFGLQVAALAGLPRVVLVQARSILEKLESGMATSIDVSSSPEKPSPPASPQLGLFAPPMPSPVEETVRGLDPDSMSPREALDAIYRLKRMT